MRYALINDGTVENVILWDGSTDYEPPAGTTLVEIGSNIVHIGYLYDGTTFTNPNPPTPE